ncbi:MAG: DUF1624 domain-containing protein [Oscillospiraceae bacterium]|nr:DUF1624 domain-containing protein [Oscillospiraceae bacterium]
MEQTGRRIELMDAMRGFAIFVMIAHHILYDLCAFCGLPWSWFTSPGADALHYVSAVTFIILAGVSSHFSHSNVRRGLRALVIALGITLVTTLMGMPVRFGVLHMLGTCMVLYGLTQRFWQRLNPWALLALCVVGALATWKLELGYPTTVPHLWMFGLTTPEFYSSDYFPLLPWAFVFLFGTWAGPCVRDGRLPQWFYTAKAPFLAAVGRKSMLIYVVHQPVLYALTMLGLWIHRTI